MSYLKATGVLPAELLEEIWRYVDGAYIYIPRKPEKRRAWGTGTSFREEIAQRDALIFKDYQNGLNHASLSSKYHLSEKSVQRIVLRLKNQSK